MLSHLLCVHSVFLVLEIKWSILFLPQAHLMLLSFYISYCFPLSWVLLRWALLDAHIPFPPVCFCLLDV